MFLLDLQTCKTPSKKDKQQIIKEWTKQLTQMPISKPRQAQSEMNCLIYLLQVCELGGQNFEEFSEI